ncbi:MAG: glycosyltransferase family 4 protein [Candidatus Magasanikbacteria bacterium]|nr:glycosyltransferase family 4 protein [Candidatus Magasanikbacteria bacterium]
MKTLIITLEYPPQVGGIASYVNNLASHLPAQETFVYAPKMKGDALYDGKNGWRVFRMKPYFSFFWPRWIRMYWQVRKIVKRQKIGRLMIQHVLPAGYIGFLIMKSMKVPYYIFMHGSDLEVGLKKKRRKLSMVCRYAEKVIVSSIFLKNKLLSRIDDLKNVSVVYPAPGDNFLAEVDQSIIAETKAQLALQGKKVIITVSRLAEGKGFPHLIRLLPQILKRVPNAAWLIIGDGQKKQEIIDLVQKNNLQNVVRFLGQIENELLPLYYHLADLFVLLTHRDETAEEGWGTVFMEAAACGLPVVAGSVGGVDEAVENLVTGLLVDTYQDTQVVSAVAELLLKSDYARQMGRAGRERVLQDFTWEKQAAKITQ